MSKNMPDKQTIKKRNKTLINLPYYDNLSKDHQRRDRYFKKYLKTYKVKKIVKKKLYSTASGRKDKNVFFLLDAGTFFLLNNIYCVLNLESVKKALIKKYPSIEKVLSRNVVEINKKNPDLLVAMNFQIALQNAEKQIFYIGSGNEIFSNLDDFCTFYENFIRRFYVDTIYEHVFKGIRIGLIYRYGENKTKKNPSQKNKEYRNN